MVKLTKEKTPAPTGSNIGPILLSYVERFERLSEEIDALSADRKEVMGEAKAVGLDTAILRVAIRRRKMQVADVQEHDAMLELYEEALRKAEKVQIAASETAGT